VQQHQQQGQSHFLHTYCVSFLSFVSTVKNKKHSTVRTVHYSVQYQVLLTVSGGTEHKDSSRLDAHTVLCTVL